MNIINVDGYIGPCRNMVALYLNVLCDLSLHEEYWAMATEAFLDTHGKVLKLAKVFPENR